jgi:hypothetical protein
LITKTLSVLQARFFIYQGFGNIYQVGFINSGLSKVVLRAKKFFQSHGWNKSKKD